MSTKMAAGQPYQFGSGKKLPKSCQAPCQMTARAAQPRQWHPDMSAERAHLLTECWGPSALSYSSIRCQKFGCNWGGLQSHHQDSKSTTMRQCSTLFWATCHLRLCPAELWNFHATWGTTPIRPRHLLADTVSRTWDWDSGTQVH